MAENEKNTQKEFRSLFEGTPCAEMMPKMMAAKKAGPLFNCAEMMSQMMKMCPRPPEKKEEGPKETQEAQSPKP